MSSKIFFSIGVIAGATLLTIGCLLITNRFGSSRPSYSGGVFKQSASPLYRREQNMCTEYLSNAKKKGKSLDALTVFDPHGDGRVKRGERTAMLLFSDTDCQMCVSELMEILNELHTKVGLQCFAVCITRHSGNIIPYVAVLPPSLGIPVIPDTMGLVSKLFGVPPLPTILVLNRRGNVFDGLVAIMKDYPTREKFFRRVSREVTGKAMNLRANP